MCAIRFPRCWFFFSLVVIIFIFNTIQRDSFSLKCVLVSNSESNQSCQFYGLPKMGYFSSISLFLSRSLSQIVFLLFFFGFKINRKLELSPWPKKSLVNVTVPAFYHASYSIYSIQKH